MAEGGPGGEEFMADKKKEVGIVRGVILFIALVVFFYSAVQLFLIFKEYKRGSDAYDDVRRAAVTLDVEDVDGFSVDFEKLMKTNDEVVAWIRFDEPEVINYPVVRGDDNRFYLHHMFDRSSNKSGAIFMDCANSGDFSDENTFLYGHNMKNRSMFGNLRKYKEKSFWKKYPYFYIYTVDGKVYKYHIFAACVVDSDSGIYTIRFESPESYQEYLDGIPAKSLYKTGVKVTSDDTIVSLSTCTNVTEKQRLVIQGVREEESVMEGGTTVRRKEKEESP